MVDVELQMPDVKTVLILLAVFTLVGGMVLTWLFRNLRRSHMVFGVGFVLAFGIVELAAAVYVFLEGEVAWAVAIGLVGIFVPILSLALLKAAAD